MAKKVVIDLEVNSSKAQKELKKTNNALKTTSKAGNSATAATAKTGAAMGTLATASGTAAGGITAVGGAVGTAAGGLTALKTKIQATIVSLKTMKVAVMATGIGALLILLISLKKAFTRSEEGQNKFAKLMGVIGSVTGNLLDLLADLGEGIISVFENPKQALIDFKNLIVENITNRFNAIIDTLGFLGSAFKKVFSGDFSGALDDAKKAGNSYVDVLTGVEDSINKVAEATKGFVKELTEEAKIAGKIADQRAKADKVERKLTVERAEADRKIAELREKAADKDKVSAKDRIIALEEAGRISEEITNKEIQAAKLRLEAKQSENALTKSTKEDLDEEANLKAKLIQLETARLRQQKSITAEISAARKQEKADTDIKKATDEKEKAEAIEKIRKGLIDTEDERRAEELRKIKANYEEQIKLAEEYYGKESQTVLDLREAQKNALDQQQSKFDEKDKEKAEEKSQIAAEKLVLDKENELLSFEEQRKIINERQELLKNDETINDEDRLKLTKQFTDAKNKIKDLEVQAEKKRVADTSNALDQLSDVVGKNTVAGKGMAVAAATINTYQGVTDALAAKTITPFDTALKFINAAAILSNGIKTVKQITSVKIPNANGGSGASGASTPSSGGISQPPAFNVVGASDTNQLADAIGSQSQEPTRAYVVSNDVTTAQSMDRNIVDGASI